MCCCFLQLKSKLNPFFFFFASSPPSNSLWSFTTLLLLTSHARVFLCNNSHGNVFCVRLLAPPFPIYFCVWRIFIISWKKVAQTVRYTAGVRNAKTDIGAHNSTSAPLSDGRRPLARFLRRERERERDDEMESCSTLCIV